MNEIEEKRKERRRNLELVMFPASKNYPLDNELSEQVSGLDLDDPLEELLQEFAEFEDDFDELTDTGEIIELTERNHELYLQLGPQSKYARESSADIIQQQIQLLRETQQRLKYYLDEIDGVLPTR